jgi:hypothetical protein
MDRLQARSVNKLTTIRLHDQFAQHLSERALNAVDQPDVLRAAFLRAQVHRLASRNPRAAGVMFRMLPGQSKPAGFARISSMLPKL